MKRIYRYILSGLFIFCVVNSALALKIGEKSPPLQIRKWVKNGPVKLADGLGKNIYVVEFWATWCPPCRQTIPLLSELQAQYKDSGVVIVGISSEPLDKVEKYVKSQKDMEYNVAVDDQRKTTKNYMSVEASIPFCFVIDKQGNIAWKGHPIDLSRVLPQVIAGNFDADAQEKISAYRSKLQVALQTGNEENLVKYTDKILQLDPENSFALGLRLSLYERKRQIPEALKFINDLLNRAPNNKALYFVKLNLLGSHSKYAKELTTFSQIAYDHFQNDAVALNQLAWMLMDKLPFGRTPLAIVLKAAKSAVDQLPKGAEKSKSAAFYDTLARAYYMVGKFKDAIEAQEKALTFANGTDEAKSMEQVLDFYKNAMKIDSANQE